MPQQICVNLSYILWLLAVGICLDRSFYEARRLPEDSFAAARSCLFSVGFLLLELLCVHYYLNMVARFQYGLGDVAECLWRHCLHYSVETVCLVDAVGSVI